MRHDCLLEYASIPSESDSHSANCSLRVETIDGTAVSGEDYVPLKEIVTFQDGETEKELHVEIVDDNQWEPDETFFLKLCILPEDVGQVLLGRVCIMEITILNDDGKGQ